MKGDRKYKANSADLGYFYHLPLDLWTTLWRSLPCQEYVHHRVLSRGRRCGSLLYVIRFGEVPLLFQSVDWKPIKQAGHPARRLQLRLDESLAGSLAGRFAGNSLSLVDLHGVRGKKKAHLFIGVCAREMCPNIGPSSISLIFLPLFPLSRQTKSAGSGSPCYCPQ